MKQQSVMVVCDYTSKKELTIQSYHIRWCSEEVDDDINEGL